MIYSILVLFNCRIEESKTFNSLLQNYANNPEGFNQFKLLIYDNGLSKQRAPSDTPFECQYIHNPQNEGLAVAYNYALEKAISASCNWMLLLDQDSSLPKDFISNLLYDISCIKDDAVMAVIPRIQHHRKPCSPAKVLYGGTLRAIEKPEKGICTFKVFAIGSGSVIRVSFLQQIGGFNTVFWLDCLDRWLYFIIHKMGGKVFITHSVIEHELSIMNYDLFMNEMRYGNILKYETLFMKTYKSQAEYFVFCLRLLKRCIYLYFTVNNKIFASMTFSHLKKILLRSNDVSI